MADDVFYRVLLIALYAMFFGVRGYYRFLKPRQVEPEPAEVERKAFGKAEAVMIFAILGYFGSLILYLLGLSWFDWSQISGYPESIRWIGVVIVLGNIPLLGWIHRTLDRQYSACLRIKESHLLITEGAYARVRHPMYTVLNAFSIGISLLTANFMIIGFAILVAIPFHFVAQKEEQMLLETFGERYSEYMQRTGRFFPRLRK